MSVLMTGGETKKKGKDNGEREEGVKQTIIYQSA